MVRLGRRGFLLLAVVFHLIYTFSIFDVYFVSPIVRGMKEFEQMGTQPPAKRLVLFVGDGLRADKAFQSFPDPSPAENDSNAHVPRPLAPYLRSRVLEHGTFGVSHTRVPTESRPGHVALIAGLYEDVSAVTTGWKLNPVNFDSVFNRSRHTWSWGSPDILPMFREGAVEGRIDTDTYGHEFEDFTMDATALDTWVFERVEKLFKEDARRDLELDEQLREEGNVFFLHLLGLDTSGHSYRPYSKEYLHNIKVVDKGVKEVTDLVEGYFADGQTAFIFTADHGMSDWGSHGDGHPDNTRTPLIAWGSGVAKPVTVPEGQKAEGHDELSADWGLDHVQRNDVAQADVAALMAYLIGKPYPVNSVGELPLSYLAASKKEKAEGLVINAQQILEMCLVKQEQKKAKTLRFVPFGGFGDSQSAQFDRISDIYKDINEGRPDQAIAKSTELIHITLQGLRYLQTYDWLFLRVLITLGYLGFIAFAITTVIDMHVLHGRVGAVRSGEATYTIAAGFTAFVALLAYQQAPWSYYAYAVFPVLFWEEVFAGRKALKEGVRVLMGEEASWGDYAWVGGYGVGALALLEALVRSYHHREVYTVCYVLGIFWPALYGKAFMAKNRMLVATWACCCLLMSIFTLLPANKVESLTLINTGGVIMFMTGAMYILFEKSIIAQSKSAMTELASTEADTLSRTIFGAQIGLVILAMFVTKSSVVSLQAREGLPLGTQVVGWITLVSSLIVPFLHGLRPNSYYLHRLVVIFLAFAPIFIILTISYEGLFFFAFCATLLTWVRLEHHIYTHTTSKSTITTPSSKSIFGSTPPKSLNGTSAISEINPLAPALAASQTRVAALETGNYRALTLADARIALFFLFLLQSAFFSTGNIASISSFSLDAVYRLIPIFDPFSQGALLMLKLLVPFFLISASLGVLNKRLRLAPGGIFAMVMALSDGMAMRFFWLVRDEGSWLEIGMSISHFCIVGLLGVFVAGLEGGSGVVVRGVEFRDDEEGSGSKEEHGEKSRTGNGSVGEKEKRVGNGAVDRTRADGTPDT
ncbi:PigN-domain-containing protein [Aulographum hederae CBS 113979]|uniref:GPI ethanolamine phosphate transferase 1 n=1 Tax=Aulographum hederae CBS 113979 TaxID=1176131 RepID=A0A6G1H3M8_9PEZI|nr:PigN-domain-containing protein [Aulographum hederae CBS 113979]